MTTTHGPFSQTVLMCFNDHQHCKSCKVWSNVRWPNVPLLGTVHNLRLGFRNHNLEILGRTCPQEVARLVTLIKWECKNIPFTAIEVHFDDFCFRETCKCEKGPLCVGQGFDLKQIVDRPMHTKKHSGAQKFIALPRVFWLYYFHSKFTFSC